MSTREKIIAEAIRQFNKLGYSGVTLFELAKILGMSRGNLTYHFKDKEVLLASIAQDMWSKIEAQRKKSSQFPSFENLHNHAQLIYQFQKTYQFIFLDSHVLNHPIIKSQFRKMTEQSIADNEAAIAFAIKIGNMKEESIPGLYHNIALLTWMIGYYWFPQQVIRGSKPTENGEKMIWSLLIPHFTEKGISSFISYFGEKYYKSLGKPFNQDIASYITF